MPSLQPWPAFTDVPYRRANCQRTGGQQASQQSSRRETETKQKLQASFPDFSCLQTSWTHLPTRTRPPGEAQHTERQKSLPQIRLLLWDAAETTLHDLFESYDAQKQTDVVILDFSKAFDTVPHNKLLHKLDHYGIRGPIHKWLTNFLTKRKMRVVLEGEASGEATFDSGVPQGTVLGLLLFLCHINDLPEAVKSNVRLFADDCMLYWNIDTPQDQITLQEDLRHLEDLAKKWGMRFNAQKCYILSSRSKSTHMYSVNGVFLK